LTLTGIADEASRGIDGQIATHQELGWSAIELRLIDGLNVAGALPDAAFAEAADKIEAAGLEVAAFSSAIGNWSRKITDDFDQDIRELKTAIPRMQRLGARYIRTMSWLQGEADDTAWGDEAIRRYRELARIAEDGDVYLAHENCTGWGGQSAEHMRELQERAESDHLVVLFDIGNTISHGHEPWPFYAGVKDLIRYVHVKDCRVNPAGGRSSAYTYPGEGDALVRPILADLLGSGYTGTIAIEPHVASIVHEGDQDVSEDEMYLSYLRYARSFEKIVHDVLGSTPQ
jgi:sugar phosphate isomerase/epimerase